MKYKTGLAVLTALLISADMAHANGLLGMNTPAVESNFSFNNGVKMYAGGSLGYANQSTACNTPFFEGDCEDGSMSYKIVGGVRMNPMFGGEIAYVNQGEAELKGTAGGQSVSSTNDLVGYQVTGVGYLPVVPDSVPNLEILGKAGVMFWERNTRTTEDGEITKSTDDGISPVIGIGAQYQFHQNMYFRTEWEHAFSTGSDSDHETDTNNYSAGIIYSTL